MLAAGVGLLLFVVLLPVLLNDPRATLLLGLAGFAGALMRVPSEASPVDLRVVVALAIVVRLVGDVALGEVKDPFKVSVVRRPVIFAVLLLVVLSLASILWTQSTGRTLVYIGSWLGALVFGVQHLRRIGQDVMIRLVRWFLGVIVALSAVSLVTGFVPKAWVQGRAAGVLVNANGLGIVCLMFIGLTLRLPLGKALLLSVVPAGVLLATASRASLLGLVVMIVWVVLHRPAWRFIAIFCAPLILVLGFDLLGGALSDSSSAGVLILRTNNSRGPNWVATQEVIANSWHGVGAGVYPGGFAANSYLALGADFGIYLALLILIVFLVAYWQATRDDFVLRAFLLGSLANAIFEGWLFTGGSLYTFILVVLMCSAAPRHPAPPGSVTVPVSETPCRRTPTV